MFPIDVSRRYCCTDYAGNCCCGDADVLLLLAMALVRVCCDDADVLSLLAMALVRVCGADAVVSVGSNCRPRCESVARFR